MGSQSIFILFLELLYHHFHSMQILLLPTTLDDEIKTPYLGVFLAPLFAPGEQLTVSGERLGIHSAEFTVTAIFEYSNRRLTSDQLKTIQNTKLARGTMKERKFTPGGRSFGQKHLIKLSVLATNTELDTEVKISQDVCSESYSHASVQRTALCFITQSLSSLTRCRPPYYLSEVYIPV